ncbi:MAG: 3-hydroxyacyl-CoA dehydrogenase/enoyl-CoA hydratase family protein [Oligoflexales bacterium]
MKLKMRKAAVLGSGVMGSQIAALLAAAGIKTHLLDLPSQEPPKDPKQAKIVGKNIRSARAILALEGLKTLKPSPIMHQKVFDRLIPGNFEDDISVLSEVDWVIEAVVEDPKIKEKMVKLIKAHARKDIPITTNTSGLSIKSICKDDEHFARQFFGVHFFNPPRYMKLVEIIPHDMVDMKIVLGLTQWISETLGKGIVFANDTINFVGNRIGVFAIQSVLKHMEEFDLNIETVDELTGPLMGRAKSATFRTMDVVGIDVFAHVARNVYELVPDDPYREMFAIPPWIQTLIKKGHLGQKANSVGMYKKEKLPNGKSEILAYRPKTESYEPLNVTATAFIEKHERERNLFTRLENIFAEDNQIAKFMWACFKDLFSYSSLLLSNIANGQTLALDSAMKWGFNWQTGPFETWQGVGFDKILARMQAEGVKVPSWCQKGLQFYKPNPNSIEWQARGPEQQWDANAKQAAKIDRQPHVYHLPKFQNKDDKRVVLSTPSVSLVDIGDGVACLTFHSKMNAVNTEILNFGFKAVDHVAKNFDGMLIANENDSAFSAGADLKEITSFIEKSDWNSIESMLKNFQGLTQAVKFAPFPTVACAHDLVLGGGCEFAMHTSRQIVAGETYAGLVEIGVGLLPAGGGTKELAIRAYNYAAMGEKADPMPFLQKAFFLIGMAKVSTSGYEAVEMGLLPNTATVTLSKDHLVHRGKLRLLNILEVGYEPRSAETRIQVVGDPGIQTFKMILYNMVQSRLISEYDAFIGEKIATILCGGPVDSGQLVTEAYLLQLERDLFVELCHQKKTQDRILHMLKTGKPLRN